MQSGLDKQKHYKDEAKKGMLPRTHKEIRWKLLPTVHSSGFFHNNNNNTSSGRRHGWPLTPGSILALHS